MKLLQLGKEVAAISIGLYRNTIKYGQLNIMLFNLMDETKKL